MLAIITQERERRGSLGLAIPLALPSNQAAWAFLESIVPSSIFSSGSGRRRRRGPVAESIGRRSDQGYLLFYRRDAVTGAVMQRPLKSPSSIKKYLSEQLGAPPAEHWFCLQSTQYRAQRDGRELKGGFTSVQARHLLMFVADLDGSRMDPLFRRLLVEDWYAFLAFLDEMLSLIGISHYRVVRSGPEGVHVYLPFVRPDGRPLRASEENLELWTRVAKALNRYLAQLGADANAVKPTQPFAVPGLQRAKHPGFIPYVAGGHDGEPAEIYTLLRALTARKLVHRREKAQVIPLPSPVAAVSPQERFREIAERAAGLAEHEGRNQAAHDIAVYLLCKGVAESQVWEALNTWNKCNAPPLSETELRGCYKSALRCPASHAGKFAQMQRAPWNRLRTLLGLPAEKNTGYRKNGLWHPLTPRKPWEVRKATGGREHFEEVAERVLQLVALEGGQVAMTQVEICNRIDTNRSTLKAVLSLFKEDGRLAVETKRGRGGASVLSRPEEVPQNGQTGCISTVGVKKGERVGPDVSAPLPSPGVTASPGLNEEKSNEKGVIDPLEVLAGVFDRAVGLDLRGYVPVPVIMVLQDEGTAWRIVARNEVGDVFLDELGRRRQCMVELERRLGCAVVLDREVWRPDEDPVSWFTGGRKPLGKPPDAGD